LIKDAMILSYDDSEGLRHVLGKVLAAPFEKIAVAYGTSGASDYSFLEQIDDPRLIKIRERKRLGKVAAINSCIDLLNGDLIYLMSSDIVLDASAVLKIEDYFFKDVAVVFPYVKPVELPGGVTKAGVLLWQIRDVFLQQIVHRDGIPHGGEMIVFRRNLLPRIPDVVNDEEYICMSAASQGKKVVYASDVRISNIVPGNAKDYITQRSRIIYGHRQMWALGFRPQVMDFLILSNPLLFIKTILSTLRKRKDLTVYMIPLMILETISLLRSKRYQRRENVLIWEFAASTKPAGRGRK